MTSILKADTIQDTDGNNIINESSNTITIGASGDTISIPSGATFNINGTAGTGIGVNTPAFEASLSGDQSISNNTSTKITFNTEQFDTAGAYDNSSNYRFTPQTAGKYYVYCKVELYGGSTNSLEACFVQIKKNGSTLISSEHSAYPDNIMHKIFIYNAGVVDFNGSSDYVEAFAQGEGNQSNQTVKAANRTTLFGAYKLIE